MEFLNGQIDRIKVVGGVEGLFIPEKMLKNHEADYNLDGFRLYDNRPVRRGAMIVSK
jgi:hypothetical protein